MDSMQQHDRLVTPTLEQLLTVAQNKALPRIRERRPPPARVGAAVSGYMRWGLFDRCGREVRGGEGPNLILDQGLDQIAATILIYPSSGAGPASGRFPIIAYCAVGTDNTSPASSQTGLGSESARTTTTYASETLTRPGDGVYELTRFIEFGYDEANGNLTEWGFSNSEEVGSNLFNRALFLDGGGSPEVVTKSDEFKLRIAYTLQIALTPVALTPGSFTITNVGTVNGDYALVGAAAPASVADPRNAPDLRLFSALARGELGIANGAGPWPTVASARVWGSDLSGVSYADAITNDLDAVSATVARELSATSDAYTPGSFQRAGGGWMWDTGFGNLNPIRGFVLGGNANFSAGPQSYVAYAFDLDPGDEFEKDDEHALTIGAPTVTWGRA